MLTQWVKTLLFNFKAVINHCGNISQQFDVLRGCRQGCPLSPTLFVLSVEILAHKLRQDAHLLPFNFNGNDNGNGNGNNARNGNDNMRHIIDLYADDSTLYLHPTNDNLKRALSIIKSFYELSLLKINVSKTKAVWFGREHNSNIRFCEEDNLDWDTSFKLLGITFDNNLEKMDENFFEKIKEMEKVLNSWLYRYLTPYGKITVIKSLALSKISHLALVLPSLNAKMIKDIEKILLKFLWNGKSEKVARKITYLPTNKGGLGMVDVKTFWASLKFSWIRRISTSDAFWVKILNRELSDLQHDPNNILFQGPSELQHISKKIKNPFWKCVIDGVGSMITATSYCMPSKFFLLPIFRNPLFKIGNRAIPLNIK